MYRPTVALITAKDLSLSFSDQALFTGADIAIEPGERVCLVGRNGAGKTSLLRVLAGRTLPDGGTVAVQRDVSLRFLSQEPEDHVGGTAFDVAHRQCGGSAEAELDVRRLLTRLGVDPAATVSTMSGGEQRRVFLAGALAGDWSVLLLDEPTNHLDIDTITWLEEYLVQAAQSRGRALIFVSHDRALARRLATRVAAIDRGRVLSYPGNYDRFVARLEAEQEAAQRQEQAFDRKLDAEEEWLRRGVKARRTRNEGRVRALMAMRETYRRRHRDSGTAAMRISEADRSGDIVIDTEGLSFAWGDRQIVRDVTTTIYRGDHVGIVGRNGSGKSTLIRLLLGDLDPQSGSVRHGSGLQVVYFDQLRAQLDGDQSLYHAIGEGYETIEVGGRRRHVHAYMQDFLFAPEERNRAVRTLSGGERNRLLLARLFARPSNLLVLDEPTNDLDAETLELLERLLVEYRGTILLVSHDREFLDNVVAECLVLDGAGTVYEEAGGYSDWAPRYNGALPQGESPAAAENPSKQEQASEATRRHRERRISYRERQELAGLPGRIETLEGEKAEIHRTLSDPGLYRNGEGERAAELSARLEVLETEISAVYERWETLESLPGAGEV